MAIYQGGDVTAITCQHPTLGDYIFFPKSNESFTLDPGGYRNNDDANGITSGGQIINQKNRVRWSAEGPVAVDFAADTEMKGLRDLAASSELGTWTFDHISGAIYKGLGIVVGDIQPDTNTAMLTLKVSGSGEMELIS